MSAVFTTLKSKRIAAGLIALLMLLGLWGCNTEVENISGKNAAGGYSFSYPETWELVEEGKNTVISIADVGGSVPYAVIRFTAYEGNGATAEGYWLESRDELSGIYDTYRILKEGAFDFEGGTAYDAELKVTIEGVTNLDGQPENGKGKAAYVVRQLIFQKEDRLCTATYMASDANDDEHGAVVDTVKKSFGFTEPSKAELNEVDGAEFSVPVPEGWTVEASEAYYTLTKGKASITASTFSIGENKTALECWNDICVPDLEASFDSYELIELNEEASLAGVRAIDAKYTLTTTGGGRYTLRQTLAVYNGDVYSVVLTATDEDYKGAEGGFIAVVEGFLYK